MTKQLSNPMLARFVNVYGTPKETENATAFIGEYARAMHNFVASECEAAADLLLAKRKYKTWPTIAECLEALEDVRRRQVSKRLADEYQAKLARQDDLNAPKPGHFQPKQLSPKEQRELEKYVDDCAAGKIDLGLCAPALRRMAQAMRARRRARA